jgi:peptidoglycan/xylan/chitin deacetylase (PgdA/CDA1 family)/glycosyltransferase involved in cell wall biosynthesis
MNDQFPFSLASSTVNAKPADTSGISVIIPAHNAQATLGVTLNSVLLQTHTVWEAVIVNDGSTDGTQVLAEAWANRDPRFHVLHQKNSGVSGARNNGLREARYPFVCFLDSDDHIDPTHLERMIGMLMADRRLDAVHCGWQRILPSGLYGPPRLAADHEDLFDYFAFQCCFPIHACVLRRDLAVAVGGFDSTLITCEDWDFFQRVARTGAHFGRVPEILAFYQVRANSASQDSRRCLADSRVVLDRGHGRDPRLQIAAPVHAEGRNPAYRNLAFYYSVAYLAAQEISEGRDGLDLLDAAEVSTAPDLVPEMISEVIHEYFAADRAVQDWPALWRQVNSSLSTFLARLEAQTRAPALAFATLQHLQKKVLLSDPSDAPLRLANAYRVNLELTRPVPDVFLPPEVDRLICRMTLKGRLMGAVEVPGTGVITGRRIARLALEGRRRLTFRLFLRSALQPCRGFYVRLAAMRELLRPRTLRQLWDLLTTRPENRLSQARQVTRDVAGAIGVSLSRILAARPGLAAERTERRWQKYLDAAVASGRAHARKQINAQSLNNRSRGLASLSGLNSVTPAAEGSSRRTARPPTRSAFERARSVPILVYHRIASDGPAAMERFRVAPDLFASQMATLHRAGYHTINLREWISALEQYEPLLGKPVILTFDDGYGDFLTEATPVLRTHGFSATVFLVPDRIGGMAEWDSEYGEPASLLSWQELRKLRDVGIEFGCHSLAHRPMNSMGLLELAKDTVRARAILEERLQTSIEIFSYPYGAENDFVRCVLADLGFKAAVNCEPAISRLGDDPLRLPRIEVPGGCTPERLLASINPSSLSGRAVEHERYVRKTLISILESDDSLG